MNMEEFVKLSAGELTESDAEKIYGAMGCSVCRIEDVST